MRPRQLVSYPMMLQHVFCDLLKTDDINTLASLLREDLYQDQRDKTLVKLLKEVIGSSYNQGQISATTKDTTEDDTRDKRMPTGAQNCIFCIKQAQDPQMTSCFHICCKKCYDMRLSRDAAIDLGAICCPCGEVIDGCEDYDEGDSDSVKRELQTDAEKTNRALRYQTRGEGQIQDWIINGMIWRSAKVVKVVHLLKEHFSKKPTEKVILLTQWIGFGKVLARVLSEEKRGYVKYKENMTSKA